MAEAPKSARHRAFCERVVSGQGLGDAWAASAADVRKEPGSQAASNVSGSRMAARYADYIAALKAERADARASESTQVTRESIHQLLEETTRALLVASRKASAVGANALAQQLNRTIVTHSGRSQRASARAPQEAKDDRPSFDSAPVLERLPWCQCDG